MARRRDATNQPADRRPQEGSDADAVDDIPLARAFRWRKMLDGGVHTTLEDLARAKGVAPSYMSRVLRLTLLAPDIVEAILVGRQPAELQLDDLLKGFPLEWKGQFGLISRDRVDRTESGERTSLVRHQKVRIAPFAAPRSPRRDCRSRPEADAACCDR